MRWIVALAFPATLFFAWVVHVILRAGNGPGLQWSRIPDNATVTAAITGVPYLAFVLVALLVLYVTRVRGRPAGSGRTLRAALIGFAAAYVGAVSAGIALAEWYCVVDERAFRRETQERSAAIAATREPASYSRLRWWPGNAQTLVSPLPDP